MTVLYSRGSRGTFFETVKMIQGIIFAAIMEIAIGDLGSVHGIRSGRLKRLAGGYTANDDRYPFVVSLQKKRGHFCGGSIISENFILTAAHCFNQTSPNLVTVKAGGADIDHGTKYAVDKIVIHEKYNRKTLENDIALVKLTKPIKFNRTIQPVRMFKRGERVVEGHYVIAIGWGAMREPNDTSIAIEDDTAAREGFVRVGNGKISKGKVYPVKLRSVDLRVISNKSCAKRYASPRVLQKKMCLESPMKDVCSGDSGGPVYAYDRLAGIISGGYGCARGYPGTVVEVAEYRDWIYQNTKILENGDLVGDEVPR
ncbi:hypothetical protein QAD02_003794 [Eretmocerus hayati]|uniref:Uncharacterized protein n=1 Tax=Eretmocerus hayati TaxID=131215 RepID=A0ACC2NMN8_9HYME|nr:hypothetical protein QAD02_003794 [Eretmocerus hayati]